jgi:hypothetical protein
MCCIVLERRIFESCSVEIGFQWLIFIRSRREQRKHGDGELLCDESDYVRLQDQDNVLIRPGRSCPRFVVKNFCVC